MITDIRIIAIDWSGAQRPEKKLWRAEFFGETPIALECGLNRDKIVDYLIQAKDLSATTFVGIDFAFSYPEWFVHKQGCSSAPEFWRIVRKRGESGYENVRLLFGVDVARRGRTTSYYFGIRSRTQRPLVAPVQSRCFKFMVPAMSGLGRCVACRSFLNCARQASRFGRSTRQVPILSWRFIRDC